MAREKEGVKRFTAQLTINFQSDSFDDLKSELLDFISKIRQVI